MLLSLAQIKKESKNPKITIQQENFQTDQTSFHSHNLCFNFDNLTLCAFSSNLFQLNFTLFIILIEIPKQHYNLTKMGNKRNRRSRRGQLPSLERELSTSEIETSQGNETVIETLSNFENVSSVRDEEIALNSGTQNENEMQIWTRRISDKTNKEVAT